MDPIQVIQDWFRSQRSDHSPTPGRIWASHLGYGVRRIVAQYDPSMPPTPLSPRALRTFHIGDVVSDTLRMALRSHWPDVPLERMPTAIGDTLELAREAMAGGAPLNEAGIDAWERATAALEALRIRPEDKAEVQVRDGWVISAKPDAILEDITVAGVHLPRAILEVKSTQKYGMQKFQAMPQGIGSGSAAEHTSDSYAAQLAITAHGHGVKDAVWLYLAKDSAAIAQRRVRIEDHHVAGLLEKAQKVADLVDAKTQALTLPPCEGPDFGQQDNGDLKWGCGYCPFWQSCFPNHVQIAMSKTVVRPRAKVKPGKVVTAVGHGIDKSEISGAMGCEDRTEDTDS